MKIRWITIAGGLVAWATLPFGYADVLVSYDFKGQDGTQVVTEPYQVATHIEASAVTRGAGFARGVRVGMSQDGMAFVPVAVSDPQLFMGPYAMDASVGHAAYFEITLTPEAGHSYTVRSALFGTRRASKRSGPNYVEVRSSLDGFQKSLTVSQDTAGPGGNESSDLFIDFGRTLTNLHTAVTLRFYGYGRGLATEQPGIWVITNPSEGVAVIDGEVRKN